MKYLNFVRANKLSFHKPEDVKKLVLDLVPPSGMLEIWMPFAISATENGL